MPLGIDNFWIYTTMMIENENGGKGTGFLVCIPHLNNPKIGRMFLVTNKHVLAKNPIEREKARKIKIYYNRKSESDGDSFAISDLDISIGNAGTVKWKEHPDLDIDVLVFELTPVFVQMGDKMVVNYVGLDSLTNKECIDEMDISIGEEIIVLGYPLGLRHKNSAIPLVRSGMIATRIGEQLEDDFVEVDGKTRKRTIRGFLIDGAVIHGSSGSPVILKPAGLRTMHGNTTIHTEIALLLGIIAETRYSPVKHDNKIYKNYAGLGLALDAECIRETIELFY
jgi:hypothetical protein